MQQLIENVVQWGKDRGLDKVGHLAQAKYTLKETAELLDAYADQDVAKINDAIGDILVTLIVGASNDEQILNDMSYEMITDSIYSECHSSIFNALSSYENIISAETELFIRIKNELVTTMDYNRILFNLFVMLKSINHEFNQKLSLKYCLQLAYDEIKNRTGKLVDGQFIKD